MAAPLAGWRRRGRGLPYMTSALERERGPRNNPNFRMNSPLHLQSERRYKKQNIGGSHTSMALKSERRHY